MTSAAEVMMTDEERAVVEAADPNRPKSPNPPAAASSTVPSGADAAATTPSQPNVGDNVGPVPPIVTPGSASGTASGMVKHEGSGSATPTNTGGKEKDKKGRNKLSPEQKQKLIELDLQRRKVMEERCVVSG
jgi:hypothetical protein